ncbi:hypothetical protein GIB67_025107 [Kingdonia uniflora]|uniref:FAD/NAD(P)-binding domain-containing protein n=1 Tax=Kingdonia uniflora TaxID=39325 RepID=A0A7J7N825_9MAGN|nr:hypothetical protein GIB67_025107 [Kingdonia uniflora]
MMASISEEEKKRLLHCVIIGGGPTGVEFSGKLSDFIMKDVRVRYFHIKDHVRVTLIEVNEILSSFDIGLSQYAIKHLTKCGVHLKKGVVKEVHPKKIVITDGTDVPYGLLDVFALGDCAGFLEKTGKQVLPALAQIDEKMKDALQVDCTRYAPGIEILSVPVTKPTIPASIKRNFEQMEEERTKVSKILMEQKLMEKDSSKRQQEIENLMYMAREKSLADDNFYKVMKEVETNKLKLAPEYLELRFIESIANNSKIFFGNKVAEREGKFLVEVFNRIGKQNGGRAFSAKNIPLGDPFVYKHLGSMASVGRYKDEKGISHAGFVRKLADLAFLLPDSCNQLEEQILCSC